VGGNGNRTATLPGSDLANSAPMYAPDFLVALDALVHRGSARALTGRLAIGVRDAGETSWWCADFGQRVSSSFGTTAPADCDARLTIDALDAASIVATGAPRSLSRFEVAGDRRLLQRFLTCLTPGRPAMTRPK
jgi:hypothetical protein